MATPPRDAPGTVPSQGAVGPPAAPPPTPPATPGGPLGAIGRYFGNPDRQARWLISALAALPLVLLIGFNTHWALLYRIDFPGVYSPSGFLLFPSPNYVLPALASAVSPTNVYVQQYLALFADSFFCAYGAQLLVRELFPNEFTRREMLGVQMLAATFYLFNPYNVTWGYYALTLDLFLNNAGFLLAMAITVRMVRGMLAGKAFRKWDAALLGIGLGLSDPTSFPNFARTLVIEGIGFLLVLCVAIVLTFSSRAERAAAVATAKRFLAVTIPIAALLIAYPMYLLLSHWLLQPAAVAAVAAKDVGLFRPNTYNTLSSVVRLLGRSNFLSYPYASFYTNNVWVIAATWFWPLLAIIAPIVISLAPQVKDRAWIWAAELLLLPVIIWGTGAQPPFGPLNLAIDGRLPFEREFMPPFFPIETVATKLYAVLIAFSLGMLYKRMKGGTPGQLPLAGPTGARASPSPDAATSESGARPAPIPYRWRQPSHPTVGFVTVAAVSGVLLLATLPIFNGTLFLLPTGGRGGFYIPEADFHVRSYLLAHHGNAVILPSQGIYVTTSWGYTGATGLYLEFYSPSRVVVPAYWGPYQFLLNSTKELYANATRPLVPGPNPVPIPLTQTGWKQYNLTHASFYYPTRPVLNLSAYQWLEVVIPTRNPALFDQLLRQGPIWFGLETSPKHTGYYLIGAAGDNVVLSVTGTSVTLAFLIGGPNRGNYLADQIRGFVLRLTDSAYFPLLGLGHPTFEGVRTTVVLPTWVPLLANTYHVHYLIVDYDIAGGRTESYQYAGIAIDVLEADGLARPLIQSPHIGLYELG